MARKKKVVRKSKFVPLGKLDDYVFQQRRGQIYTRNKLKFLIENKLNIVGIEFVYSLDDYLSDINYDRIIDKAVDLMPKYSQVTGSGGGFGMRDVSVEVVVKNQRELDKFINLVTREFKKRNGKVKVKVDYDAVYELEFWDNHVDRYA